MRISVRFFGATREIIDVHETTVEVEEGTTLDGVMEALRGIYPALSSLSDGIILSINGRSLPGETPLSDGDEVSVLPTVTGG